MEPLSLATGITVGLERAAARAARWLDRHPFLACYAFSAVYVAAWALRASSKPLWFDELVTLYFCRLPGVREVWAAFESAADAMPPLVHLLTRASIAIFGEGLLSVRVPAMLGGWTMCICLYVFVRRHCPAVYGWAAAAMMAVAMAGRGYSEEARSYGLLLGSSGIALVCWQSGLGRRRWLWLGGLALSVALAVSSHYSATLVVIVLGLGELARAWTRRKMDWPVLGALLLGVSVILLYLPAMRTSIAAYGGNAWSTPRLSLILRTYSDLLGPLLLPLCGFVLLICAFWTIRRWSSPAAKEDQTWEAPLPEAVVTFALQFLPVIAVAAASVGGIFVSRYASPCLAGFCLMAAYQFRSIQPAGRALPVLFLAVFLAYLAGDALLLTRLPQPLSNQQWFVPTRAQADLPIVIDDPLAYLQQLRYTPNDISARLYFLADRERAQQASNNSSATTGLLMLRPWVPLHVDGPDAFLQTHRRFYLLSGAEGIENWLRPYLLKRGASLRLVSVGDLYLVDQDR